MHTLITTTTFDHDLFAAVAPPNKFHSIVTLAIGVIAVIWLAYAAIGIVLYLIGAAIIFGARALIRVCARHVRNRRERAITETDAQTKITYLDRYRRGDRRSARSQHAVVRDPGPEDDRPA